MAGKPKIKVPRPSSKRSAENVPPPSQRKKRKGK